MDAKQTSISRRPWPTVVREKLEPLKLLLPVGDGVHEWSRDFRALVFDLAEFQYAQHDLNLLDLARLYRREHPRELLRYLHDEDLAVLLRKVRDYGLVSSHAS